MEKKYEIIVYGATGFTGQICCKYLRDNYSDLVWAIAGRNGDKLEQIKSDFSLNCDVVVADGFAGNIALKSIEGVAKVISHFIKTEFTKNIFTKLSALVSLPVIKSVKQKVDPRKYNGASLVGLQGVVVKSHGGADSYAFSQAINTAYYEVKNQLLDKIESLIQTELSNE